LLTHRAALTSNVMAAPHPLSDVRQTAGKSAPPIFLGLAPHSGRFRIFDLDPMRRTSRAVQRAKPFRNDTSHASFHFSQNALPRGSSITTNLAIPRVNSRHRTSRRRL